MELYELAPDKPTSYSCFESDREVLSQVYNRNGNAITLGDITDLLNDRDVMQLALKYIAALADTGSHEHGAMFGGNAPGWRVAEKMREVAIDALRGQ